MGRECILARALYVGAGLDYLQDPEFLGDTDLLLRTDSPSFDPQHAWELVKRTFIDRMPGRRD